MVTIKEIAKKAGVSRGTVDRVLNNRHGVNTETAAKIRMIADSMQYAPSVAGRSLAARKKGIKFGCLLFSNLDHYATVERAVTRKMAELAEYGITVFTHHLNSEDVKEQIRLLGELRKQGVCGIAIEPINHPEVISKFNTLHKEGIEIVTFGNDIQGSKRLAYVGCDYYACGQTVGNMIGLLLDGHGKLAIVSGDSTYRDHPHRIAGCIDKVNKHYPGIAVVENIHCPTDDISTYTVVRELMGKHNALNALFFNAIASFGALRAIEEIGKRIKIVSTDRISDMKSYLSSGLVSAVITHQPWLQGTMPLDILFNFHVLGIKPSFDSYYTSNEIKIAENVNEQFFDDAWGKVSKQWSDISARMGPLNCTENTFVSPSQPRPEG